MFARDIFDIELGERGEQFWSNNATEVGIFYKLQ